MSTNQEDWLSKTPTPIGGVLAPAPEPVEAENNPSQDNQVGVILSNNYIGR